jgi:CRISPR-associated protein Cas1
MQLILDSYGVTLRKDHTSFVVQTKEGEKQFPATAIDSIHVSRGARISSDAVLLAIEHEIDLIFVDAKGQPRGRVWSHKFGSISTIRRAQVEFLFSTESVKWVKGLIATKMDNQIALLLTLEAIDDRQERVRQRAINAIEDHKHKIHQSPGEHVSDIAPSLRGWEGAASRRYFESIGEFLPDAFKMNGRSQNPARDKVNALLNYGYGMLYGKVEGALIKAGIDPYTGIFHRDDYNRPVLVYDIIEKYRAWIDHVVVRLCQEEVFIEECFSIRNEAYWLEGLGKRILIQSVNDYLAEIIERNQRQRSRAVHIEMEAQDLAKYFTKVYESTDSTGR